MGSFGVQSLCLTQRRSASDKLRKLLANWWSSSSTVDAIDQQEQRGERLREVSSPPLSFNYGFWGWVVNVYLWWHKGQMFAVEILTKSYLVNKSILSASHKLTSPWLCMISLATRPSYVVVFFFSLTLVAPPSICFCLHSETYLIQHIFLSFCLIAWVRSSPSPKGASEIECRTRGGAGGSSSS